TEFDVSQGAGAIRDSDIVLFVVPSTLEHDLTRDVVTHFTTDENALCIYVTVAKPSRTVERSFTDAGANTDNIFYIDCATALTGTSMKRAGNVVYLKPSDLTQLSIALTNVVDELPAEREGILMFDTLSTLTIYNNAETVSQFAHKLLSRIRNWPVTGFVFTVDEETDDVIKSRLTQFSDRTIEIEA
ncbi:MAG: ATPase domain-containing protein, partial [Haloarculaceae archaeon]